MFTGYPTSGKFFRKTQISQDLCFLRQNQQAIENIDKAKNIEIGINIIMEVDSTSK